MPPCYKIQSHHGVNENCPVKRSAWLLLLHYWLQEPGPLGASAQPGDRPELAPADVWFIQGIGSLRAQSGGKPGGWPVHLLGAEGPGFWTLLC